MVDQLKSRLLAAEAQISRLKAMADQASTVRGNAVVRAPISGVIGQRFLSQGDMAAPTLPICTVVHMDRVELVVEVPEQDLARIREGMAARLSVARYPGRTFEGQVERISPTIDRVTRTARVKVVADNPKHELMPGMLARVLLEVERRKKTLVVPYSSLVIRMGAGGKVEHHAFIGKGGKAVERRLTIGIVEGKKVEVLKGLAMGETLVTQGHHMLQPGRAMRVVERLQSDGKVVKVNGEGKGAGTGKGKSVTAAKSGSRS
jgi:membrane fusion protein (multidrug efflux system)